MRPEALNIVYEVMQDRTYGIEKLLHNKHYKVHYPIVKWSVPEYKSEEILIFDTH